MKLYTEEQLEECYRRGLMDGRLNNIDYSITDSFTPIELPSNYDINDKAKDIYPINVGDDMWVANRDEVNKGYKQEGFAEGAKWVIEQIKQ